VQAITGVDAPEKPKTFSVTANRIKKQLTQTPVNPVGLTLRSQEDMHAVAALFRNPAFEATRWVFVKDNKIVGMVNLTARKANSTQIFAANLNLNDIVAIGKSLGSDSYFITHNHPSGISIPSQADQKATAYLITAPALQPFKFLGHVVTNHNQHHIIQPDPEWTMVVRPVDVATQGPDELLSEDLWDMPISESRLLARAGAAISTGKVSDFVLLLDAQNRIRSVLEVSPVASVDAIDAEIRQFAQAVGAASAAAYSTTGRPDAKARFGRLMQSGVLVDAFVLGERDSLYQQRYADPDSTQFRPLVEDAGRVAETQVVTTPEDKLRFSPQIDTPEFKAWFGKSQVVDDSGKPRVVYHGTDVDFTEFDTTDFGSWFAQSPKTAEQYAEKTGEGAARTVPAFLRVEKPFVIPDEIDLSQDTTVRSFLRAVNAANGTKLTVQDLNLGNFNLTQPRPAFEFVSFNDGFFEAVKALGFDGLKANELGEPTWNVFAPEQVKSATGNRGTFDPTNPDIRLSPEIDYNRPPQEVMKTSALNVLHGTSAELPAGTPQAPRTLDDVARMLQEVAINQWGRIINSYDITPDEYRVLLDNAVNEAVAALKASGKNAFDWYTAAVERAVEIMAVIHPELKDDAAAKATGVFPDAEAAKLGMMMAMAITSQNLSVDYNSRYAEEQFSALRSTGKFDPSRQYGTKASSISSNLQLANTLIEKLGWQEANKFLATSFTVGQVGEAASQILGKKVSVAGRVNDTVQGAAIFGPKIGQGFLQNLRGNYLPVTIDLWMRRTWGRWTGDVMEADPLKPERVARLLDAARAKKYVLPDQLKTLRTVARARKTGSEFTTLSDVVAQRVREDRGLRDILLKITSDLTTEWQSRYKSVKSLPVRPEDAQALRDGKLTLDQLTDRQLSLMERLDVQYGRLKDKSVKKDAWREIQFAALGHTERLSNKDISEHKPEWANAAIVIENALGPTDIPTDQDREVISRLVNDIRGRLKEQGIETTNADIQAILWYPEKDIWAKLSNGTADSDLKQSYDTEFLKIAEARGLGEQARAAVERYEAARAARTGGADDAPADGAVRGEAAGPDAAAVQGQAQPQQ